MRKIKKTTKRKRRTFTEDNDCEETPISELINFGPVTRPEFESLGLKTIGDLRRLGWEDVCRRWVKAYPQRLNVNAFIGVLATLEGMAWTRVSSSQRRLARALVNELRAERGLKPVAKALRRR